MDAMRFWWILKTQQMKSIEFWGDLFWDDQKGLKNSKFDRVGFEKSLPKIRNIYCRYVEVGEISPISNIGFLSYWTPVKYSMCLFWGMLQLNLSTLITAVDRPWGGLAIENTCD